MSNGRHYLRSQPLQDGYQIFSSGIEVAGIHFHRDDAKAFASATKPQLEFELDVMNSRHPDAIKIIGCWPSFFRAKRRMLGFVPQAIAKAIAQCGCFAEIHARLESTSIGKGGYVEVRFQVIGPKARYPFYQNAMTQEKPTKNRLIAPSHLPTPDLNFVNSIKLLLRSIGAEEQEAKILGRGVSPGLYESLANIYRKTKRLEDEIAILERFASQPQSPGVLPVKLAERLIKAKKSASQNAE